LLDGGIEGVEIDVHDEAGHGDRKNCRDQTQCQKKPMY
jgi:hypothetical protein